MRQESAIDDEYEPGTGAVACALFPAGLASGRSFVNRDEEFKRLTDDIVQGRNTWFDCPPRYGVSSLIDRVCEHVRHWHSPRITSYACQLNAVHDARSFCEAVLECAGQLASQTIRRPNVNADNIEKLFQGLEAEIYLDQRFFYTIHFPAGSDPVTTMLHVLKHLDGIAAVNHCRNVFVMHDMQQILALRERDILLAAISGAIRNSQQAIWLMHGHNRHAMQRLFQDPDAVMHGSCRRFSLRPINPAIYGQYLSDAAQSQWKCYIGRKATAMILALSDRHPYWFNELCRRLWSSDLPPVIQDVVNAWCALVDQHRHTTSREMEQLSPNQRAVLICLAETPTDQPRAKSFVQRTRVSSASVGQAIKILAERDLIRSDPDGVWSLCDPVMQWSLHPRMDIVASIYDTPPDLIP